MADRIQITADHIAGFHEYMSEISDQLTEVGTYVWDNIAETDAYGSGLLAPLKGYIRDEAVLPFGDALEEARSRLGDAQRNLWQIGANFDRLDGEVSTYFFIGPVAGER